MEAGYPYSMIRCMQYHVIRSSEYWLLRVRCVQSRRNKYQTTIPGIDKVACRGANLRYFRTLEFHQDVICLIVQRRTNALQRVLVRNDLLRPKFAPIGLQLTVVYQLRRCIDQTSLSPVVDCPHGRDNSSDTDGTREWRQAPMVLPGIWELGGDWYRRRQLVWVAHGDHELR
jgi:hypothetical protein